MSDETARAELAAAVGVTAARSSLLACLATEHPLVAEIDERMKIDVPTGSIHRWLAERHVADETVPRLGMHTLRKHRLVCLGLHKLVALPFQKSGEHPDIPTDKDLRDALKAELLARIAALSPKEIETFTNAINALGPRPARTSKEPTTPPKNTKGARARAALQGVRSRLALVGE